MIRIKVLKLKRWTYGLLFVIGIILLLIMFRSIAYNHSAVDVFSAGDSNSTDDRDKLWNDVFKNILERAIPGMEASSGGETGGSGFSFNIMGFITKLNYRDPKTFFMAEIPIMNNYDIHASRGDGERWDRGDPYDPENDIDEILRQYDVNNVQIDRGEYSQTLADPNIGEPEKTRLDMGEPLVLIYHTHTSEAYEPSKAYNYTPTDVDRTIDPRYSVVRVGKELKDILEDRYDIKVIHNTTFHDYPDYGLSYSRSLNTVQNILARNPSLKILIDIHRDAFPMRNKNEIDKARTESVKVINGENVARIMIVWGPDAENSRETRKFAELLKNRINGQVSGLCRKVLEKSSGRYNQHLSDYSALVEVGSNANTMEEALRSVPYLARAISEAITEIGE